MGHDFISSKRQSRRKGWNFQLGLGGQDLFAVLAPVARRTCRAKVEGELPALGHTVLLQLTKDREVLVREENVCIGRVRNPSPELMEDLDRHAGMVAASVKARLKGSNAIDLLVEN